RHGRFAVNCGVVGKADHDGDPSVHYALVDLPRNSEPGLEIRRVAYDHEAWARRMEEAGIAPIFVEPVRTGIWTTGIASLPASERFRWLRSSSVCNGDNGTDWRPEFLDASAWKQRLQQFHDLGLVSEAETAEALSLLE